MTPFKVYYAMRGSGRIKSEVATHMDSDTVRFEGGGYVLIEDAFLTEEQCRRDWEAKNISHAAIDESSEELEAIRELGYALDNAAAEIFKITNKLKRK